MTSNIDQEVEAIKIVLQVLEPLSPEVRQNVLDYAIKRLSVKSPIDPSNFELIDPSVKGTSIKQLKEEKKPKSAIEMAVLVAYYLTNLAPENERKITIGTKDIESYFKMAKFKLPTKIGFTLPNTKKAGYLDSVEKGEYKLNPVGYNLVVHSMPRKNETVSSRPKRTKKQATKRDNQRKSLKEDDQRINKGSKRP